MTTLSLFTLVIQLNPIKSFSWSTTENILLLLSESNKVYIITPVEASICDIPTETNLNLNLNNVKWAPNGKSFIVSDRVC